MRTTTRRIFKNDDVLYDVEYATPAGMIQFVWINEVWVKVFHTSAEGVTTVNDASNESEARMIANLIIKIWG